MSTPKDPETKDSSKPAPLKKVVLFDVDETIFNAHFHNLILDDFDDKAREKNVKEFKESAEYKEAGNKRELLEKFIDSPKFDEGTFGTLDAAGQRKILEGLIREHGIKNRNALKDTIQNLINAGVKVGFSSYSEYSEIFIPTLEIMGFPKEVIEHFKQPGHIVSFTPTDQSSGKVTHIKQALEKMNNTYKASGWHAELGDVVLVDDSENNVRLARKAGVLSIQAPKHTIDDKGTPSRQSSLNNYLKELEKSVLGETLQQRETKEAGKPMVAGYQQTITTTQQAEAKAQADAESKEEKKEQPKPS